jgi:hypothetical protein
MNDAAVDVIAFSNITSMMFKINFSFVMANRHILIQEGDFDKSPLPHRIFPKIRGRAAVSEFRRRNVIISAK